MPDLNVNEQKIASDIIESCKSELYDKVLFLGPYARRVSFSSQQNRAMNLVWAVDGLELAQQGDDIAVIGGGISGITASAALAHKGFKVSLFESGKSVLNRQIGTLHRFIHPTVNGWPSGSLHATTQLPYFDWMSDICARIMELLYLEWEERQKEQEIGLARNCRVTDYHEAAGTVSVICSGDNKFSNVRFKLVLVTSGFDDEELPDGLTSDTYWRHENLESDINQGKYEHYNVVGCGDGGIIDSLRIAHRNFNYGELIIRVAEELNNHAWHYREQIIEAESEYDGGNVRKFLDDNKTGSSRLRDVYTEGVKQLPVDVREMLDKSIRDSSPRLVNLITLEEIPFTPSSAPIHKLLLAHALDSHVVFHRKKSEVISYKKPTKEDPTEGVMVKVNETTSFMSGKTIYRRGARPNFEQFFLNDMDACEDLIKKQRILSPDLDKIYWQSSEHPLISWPPLSPYSRDDLMRREPHAKKILEKVQGVSARFVTNTEDGFCVICESIKDKDKFPTTLFGFNVLVQDEQSITKGEKTRPHGGVFLSEPSNGRGDKSLYPGMRIASSLPGRLGPICKDQQGRLVALTVAHVLYSPTMSQMVEVTNAHNTIIGEVIEESDSSEEYKRSSDNLSIVYLNSDLGIKSAYAGFKKIKPLGNTDRLFGKEVLMTKQDGSFSKGYVSGTFAPVEFYHPTTKEYVLLKDAIRVTSLDIKFPFSVEGDSGAPVVTTEGELVGIIVSGNIKNSFVIPTQDFLLANNLQLLGRTHAAVASENKNGKNDTEVATDLWNLAIFHRESVSDESPEFGEYPEVLDDLPDEQSYPDNEGGSDIPDEPSA